MIYSFGDFMNDNSVIIIVLILVVYSKASKTLPNNCLSLVKDTCEPIIKSIFITNISISKKRIILNTFLFIFKFIFILNFIIF